MEILRTNQMIEYANIPDRSDLITYINYDSQDNTDEMINYYKNHTNIDPMQYKISYNNKTREFNVSSCIPEDFNINSLINLRSHYSDYSMRGLELFNLNESESWNGPICDMSYDKENSRLEFKKTDYYTIMIHMGLIKSEFINACESNNCLNPDDVPLRKKLLNNVNDFYNTSMKRSMSCSGVIYGIKDGSIYVLILTRSDMLDINPNCLSSIGGAVEYDSLKCNFDISKDVTREFEEELFKSNSDAEFVLDNAEVHPVCNSWKLSSGGLNFTYAIVINEIGFNRLLDKYSLNFEHSELNIFDIQRVDEIIDFLDKNKVHSPFILKLMETLDFVKKYKDNYKLNYNILKSKYK